MGVRCSRCGCKESRHGSIAPLPIPGPDPAGGTLRSRTPSWQQDREEALRLLREEFKRRPTVFLLSQIIMTVQFFKDFGKDKMRILQLKQEKEDQLNRSLLKDKKSVAYLGSPYEVIGEVMAYCRAEGEDPCLGHDLEYLIFHDSIAVKTPTDDLSPEEEAREYQFVMQKCRSEGYIRLRQTGRIRAPTSSHRSRRSTGRQWQQQPPLAEAEGEPAVTERGARDDGREAVSPLAEAEGEQAAAERGARDDGTEAVSPTGRGQSRAAEVAAENAVGSDDQKRGVGLSPVQTRVEVHMSQTEPDSGPGGGQKSDAKRVGPASEEARSRGSSRPNSADSLSEDSERASSSSLNSDKEHKKEQEKGQAASSTNHQGQGQKFLEELKRKMNGDSNAHVDLSDEEQTDVNDSRVSQKPRVTVTDEHGTNAKTSTESDSAPKSTVDAAHRDARPEAVPYPGQVFPGGFPVANGIPMSHISASYQQAFPGQAAHMPHQAFPMDRSAHFPRHLTPQHPFTSPSGVPGPFQIPGAIPGYQQPGPGHSSPFLSHPAAPHYFPMQPAINPYQQFAGVYPAMASPLAGWPQGQPGDQQPFLPGVPLANQNPAVGFGMPGFPGQAVPPGYLLMYPTAAPNAHHQLSTISEDRVAVKPSRRAGGEAKPSSNHLVPPPPRHGPGLPRSRSNSKNNLLDDFRRGSNASSTSRFSFMQESTTTDEEADTPGLVPHRCFRKVRMRVDTGDEDDEDVWREPHKEMHRFLLSERFLGVFADRFGELVQIMASDAWLQHAGRGQLSGPVVQCREVLPSGLRTTARVTATLLVSNWPSEQAFEWALRRRPERLDMRRRVRYVWPPQRVVQTILQEVGCNLVPMGSRRSPTSELEWEIAFQQAEIKLISSLDLVHVHCWAVAKLFFTHFLSDFGCLQERHIRHLMFWQFENNFRDWHLESLGATFVELLSSLKESVRERRLEHYFIRKRNLLQNESTGDLVNAQEKLQRVMENLLPNTIILMNRLQVRNEAFPTFDWQELYDTLRMSTTDIMKKIIPELGNTRDGEGFFARDSLIMFNPDEHGAGDDDDDGWNLTRRQQIEASYRRWQREQQRQRNRRRQQQIRATSAHGTQLPAFAGRNDKLNTLGDGFQPRTEMVLSLFIRHFSAMAERLIEHKSIETALCYIDHSLNLCTLLGEEGGTETAEELREKLIELQALVAAELPPPEDDVSQMDPDLLQMASGGGGTSDKQSNWTVGPDRGHATRRDFNREAAAAAAAGDMAEWQARGGARPETEGGDEEGGRDPFHSAAILGEMHINPAFVEDEPKPDEDEDVIDGEEVEDRPKTSRGEADGSEDMDEVPHGPAFGRSQSGSRGGSGHVIDDEEDEEDEVHEGDDDEKKEETEDDGDAFDEGEEDEDSKQTKM